MKFLEFSPDTDPKVIFDYFAENFLEDIFSALRNNKKFQVDPDEPMSPAEIVRLFSQIVKTLNLVNGFCKVRYKCTAASIKVEMRIRNGSFVWFRFVPLDSAKEPIMKEKENLSLVLPMDVEQAMILKNEGYNIILFFRNIYGS